MSTWTQTQLRSFAAVDDLHISSAREDGVTHGKDQEETGSAIRKLLPLSGPSTAVMTKRPSPGPTANSRMPSPSRVRLCPR